MKILMTGERMQAEEKKLSEKTWMCFNCYFYAFSILKSQISRLKIRNLVNVRFY